VRTRLSRGRDQLRRLMEMGDEERRPARPIDTAARTRHGDAADRRASRRRTQPGRAVA
jgi:hypothetical protein